MLELAASRGDLTIESMCSLAGIAYWTHRRWCRDDPGYEEVFDALREGRIDAIESNVLAELARRATPEMLEATHTKWLVALAHYLAKARRRVERSEVHVTGEVKHTHQYEQMSAEEVAAEVERRARALRLHRVSARN